jgi:RNA polymerase sigma factor (sigma-70 family)
MGEEWQMIEFEPMMYSILNKYNIKDKEDYIDICYIGYVKALKSYDRKRSCFRTYVYNSIKNEVYHEIQRQNTAKRKGNNLSLDYQYYQHDGDRYDLFDTISDNIDLEKEIIEKEKINRLYNAINKLNEKEKIIIIKYFNLDNSDCKKGNIKNEVNLSKQRVDDIRKNAIIKLRGMLENER